MSFDFSSSKNIIAWERVQRSTEKKIVQIMKNIWKFVKEHIKKSQQNQVTHANKHRSIASNYKIDDQIWLLIKNIQINKLFRKLNHKMLELFNILKKMSFSFKLNFSDEMNIYSIFHIFLLRKDFNDSHSEQIISSSSSIIIDEKEEYDVKNIIDFKLIERHDNKRLQYKVSWVKHSSDRKWYSVENFDNVKKIMIDYHARYSNKFESHFIMISVIKHVVKFVRNDNR